MPFIQGVSIFFQGEFGYSFLCKVENLSSSAVLSLFFYTLIFTHSFIDPPFTESLPCPATTVLSKPQGIWRRVDRPHHSSFKEPPITHPFLQYQECLISTTRLANSWEILQNCVCTWRRPIAFITFSNGPREYIFYNYNYCSWLFE